MAHLTRSQAVSHTATDSDHDPPEHDGDSHTHASDQSAELNIVGRTADPFDKENWDDDFDLDDSSSSATAGTALDSEEDADVQQQSKPRSGQQVTDSGRNLLVLRQRAASVGELSASDDEDESALLLLAAEGTGSSARSSILQHVTPTRPQTSAAIMRSTDTIANGVRSGMPASRHSIVSTHAPAIRSKAIVTRQPPNGAHAKRTSVVDHATSSYPASTPASLDEVTASGRGASMLPAIVTGNTRIRRTYSNQMDDQSKQQSALQVLPVIEGESPRSAVRPPLQRTQTNGTRPRSPSNAGIRSLTVKTARNASANSSPIHSPKQLGSPRGSTPRLSLLVSAPAYTRLASHASAGVQQGVGSRKSSGAVLSSDTDCGSTGIDERLLEATLEEDEDWDAEIAAEEQQVQQAHRRTTRMAKAVATSGATAPPVAASTRGTPAKAAANGDDDELNWDSDEEFGTSSATKVNHEQRAMKAALQQMLILEGEDENSNDGEDDHLADEHRLSTLFSTDGQHPTQSHMPRKVQIVMYPVPSQLYSLKTPEGGVGYSEKQLEQWFQQLITKHQAVWAARTRNPTAGIEGCGKQQQPQQGKKHATTSVWDDPVLQDWVSCEKWKDDSIPCRLKLQTAVSVNYAYYRHGLQHREYTRHCWSMIHQTTHHLASRREAGDTEIVAHSSEWETYSVAYWLMYTMGKLWSVEMAKRFFAVTHNMKRLFPAFTAFTELFEAQTISHHDPSKANKVLRIFVNLYRRHHSVAADSSHPEHAFASLVCSDALVSLQMYLTGHSPLSCSQLQADAQWNAADDAFDWLDLAVNGAAPDGDMSSELETLTWKLCGSTQHRMALLRELYTHIPNGVWRARSAFTLGQYACTQQSEVESSSMSGEQCIKLAEKLLFECVYLLDTTPISPYTYHLTPCEQADKHTRPTLQAGSSAPAEISDSDLGHLMPLPGLPVIPLLLELNINAMVLYGDVLLALDKYKYAIAVYESAALAYQLRHDSEFHPLYRRLCEICLQHNDLERSVLYHQKALRKAIEDQNLNMYVYLVQQISRLEVKRGHLRAAEENLRQALALLKPTAARLSRSQNSKDVATTSATFRNISAAEVRTATLTIFMLLARLYLEGDRIGNAITVLEMLQNDETLPRPKWNSVIIMLAQAYIQQRQFSRVGSLLAGYELNACNAAPSTGNNANHMPSRADNGSAAANNTSKPTHSRAPSYSYNYTTSPNPASPTALLSSSSSELLRSDDYLTARTKHAFHTASFRVALQWCHTAIAECSSAHLNVLARWYYRKAKILASRWYAHAATNSAGTTHTDTQQPSSNRVTLAIKSPHSPTTSMQLPTYSHPLQAYNEAVTYLTRVDDQLRLAKCWAQMVTLTLNPAISVCLLQQHHSTDAAQLSTALIHTFHPWLVAHHIEHASNDPATNYYNWLLTLDGVANDALAIAASTNHTMLLTTSYLNLAELRLLQGRTAGSQSYWLEAEKVWTTLFVTDATNSGDTGSQNVLLLKQTPGFRRRVHATYTRLLRLLLAYQPAFINQHLPLVDAYILYQHSFVQLEDENRQVWNGDALSTTAAASALALSHRRPSHSKQSAPSTNFKRQQTKAKVNNRSSVKGLATLSSNGIQSPGSVKPARLSSPPEDDEDERLDIVTMDPLKPKLVSWSTQRSAALSRATPSKLLGDDRVAPVTAADAVAVHSSKEVALIERICFGLHDIHRACRQYSSGKVELATASDKNRTTTKKLFAHMQQLRQLKARLYTSTDRLEKRQSPWLLSAQLQLDPLYHNMTYSFMVDHLTVFYAPAAGKLPLVCALNPHDVQTVVTSMPPMVIPTASCLSTMLTHASSLLQSSTSSDSEAVKQLIELLKTVKPLQGRSRRLPMDDDDYNPQSPVLTVSLTGAAPCSRCPCEWHAAHAWQTSLCRNCTHVHTQAATDPISEVAQPIPMHPLIDHLLTPALPVEHVSLALTSLDPQNILLLYAALFSQCRIVVSSTSAARVTATIHTLTRLLHPFRWRHLYVPHLLATNLPLLHATQPYIIGVPTAVLEASGGASAVIPAGVVYADLDHNVIKHERGAIVALPPKFRNKLFKAIVRYMSATFVARSTYQKNSDQLERALLDDGRDELALVKKKLSLDTVSSVSGSSGNSKARRVTSPASPLFPASTLSTMSTSGASKPSSPDSGKRRYHTVNVGSAINNVNSSVYPHHARTSTALATTTLMHRPLLRQESQDGVSSQVSSVRLQAPSQLSTPHGGRRLNGLTSIDNHANILSALHTLRNDFLAAMVDLIYRYQLHFTDKAANGAQKHSYRQTANDNAFNREAWLSHSKAYNTTQSMSAAQPANFLVAFSTTQSWSAFLALRSTAELRTQLAQSYLFDQLILHKLHTKAQIWNQRRQQVLKAFVMFSYGETSHKFKKRYVVLNCGERNSAEEMLHHSQSLQGDLTQSVRHSIHTSFPSISIHRSRSAIAGLFAGPATAIVSADGSVSLTGKPKFILQLQHALVTLKQSAAADEDGMYSFTLQPEPGAQAQQHHNNIAADHSLTKQVTALHFKFENQAERRQWLKLLQSHLMPPSIVHEFARYL